MLLHEGEDRAHQEFAVWPPGKGQHIANLGQVLVLDLLRPLQKIHAAAVVDPISELEHVRLTSRVLSWHLNPIAEVKGGEVGFRMNLYAKGSWLAQACKALGNGLSICFAAQDDKLVTLSLTVSSVP